jgi:predicted Zn-dependent protease
MIAMVSMLSLDAVAQPTNITAPKNRYSPAEDVKLGREAAAQVREQLPILRDRQAQALVRSIGERLTAAIPPAYRHPEFKYSFEIPNVADVNAFALPGGPMFIDRGIIEFVQSEGQLAGVMAHELSHVALRHGTAQATQATPYEIGAVAGQVLGAIVGGTWGNVISTGSQVGLGTYFLKYSREYERQADTLGAQIMARAGYDPLDMARLFQLLEKRGGPGVPEWLSSHPNPGSRYEEISQEASRLQVNPRQPTGRLSAVQVALKGMPPAPTSDKVTRKTSG